MRLIDADALADSLRESKNKLKEILDDERCEMEYRICEGQMITFIEAILRVNEAPTIDAVPVVRCKDCKHSTTFHHTGNMYCGLHENHHFLTDAYGFCHKGERRCENDTP